MKKLADFILKWWWLTFVPFLGGMGAIIVISTYISDENEDNKKPFNPFPLLIFLGCLLPVLIVYIIIDANGNGSPWICALFAYVGFTAAGLLNILYFRSYLKKAQCLSEKANKSENQAVESKINTTDKPEENTSNESQEGKSN